LICFELPGFGISIALVVAVFSNGVDNVSATFSRSLANDSRISEAFFVVVSEINSMMYRKYAFHS
jgi:hypothetical protein